MHKILALAAAAAATILAGTTSFTPAAEAGGVRVGFGFPLGSFVARPTRGGGYGGGSSYSNPKMCKKKAPTHVARSKPRHEPKVARHEPKVVRHYEPAPKRASKPTVAYAKPKKIYRDTETETESIVTVEETSGTETGATGSNALIQVDSSKAEDAQTEQPATETPDSEAPAPTAEAQTETETETKVAANTTDEPAGPPAPVTETIAETVTTAAPVVEEPKVEEPKIEEPKSTKKSKAAQKDDCKKYIPAIGVTISVGC